MELEARILPPDRLGFRIGIAVERDEPPGVAETGKHERTVTAAPEGGVDVDTVGLDRQRGHGFLEQDRDVIAMRHQSEKPSSSGGRPSCWKLTA